LLRQEPHLAQSKTSGDADMQDVVQRYERAYSDVQARAADSSLQRGLQDDDIGIARLTEASPPPDGADAANDTRIAPAQVSAQAVRPAQDLPPERYELPDRAPQPVVFERVVSPRATAVREQASRRVWLFAVAAAALALLVGIAVGYSLVPRQVHTTVIAPSMDGGTRLRLDYDLRNR
jgi:hypothetical protein